MAQKLYDLFFKSWRAWRCASTYPFIHLIKDDFHRSEIMEDSSDKIKALEGHFQTVMKEFGKSTTSKAHTAPVLDAGSNLVEKLRRQISVFADLTATRSVYADNLIATAKRITEALAEAIDVERASIWLYNKEQDAIECTDLFVRTKKEHSAGVILKATDFPNYFKTVATQRTLAAENAHTDPGTSEFSDVYLRPLGINSLLDVPIYVNGKMAGVVCHEHTGDFRKWTTDEETFAYLMGNIVGMTIEKIAAK